jgi:tRNA(Ile)-lysidine synthase
MTRFPLRVLETLRRHGMVSPGERVLVACSGGPDSMALLEALVDVLPRVGASVAAVAHVHHGIRGADADADLDWCRAEAGRRGLPFFARHVDVPGEARRRRWSLERTAHVLRHAALREMAGEAGATRIALGHTRDDQAETVVLRFLRGAGTRGLGGMWPRKGVIIRPLIDISRARVEQFLAERGLSYRDDATNVDLGIPRNRIRHEVLPALVAVAGAGLPARLARQSQGWRDDEAFLSAAAEPWVSRVLTPAGSNGWRLSPGLLAEAPAALRRRIRLGVARRLLREATTARAVERLERLERLGAGKRARFGAWQVWRDDADLLFRRAGSAGPGRAPDTSRASVEADPVLLQVPGSAEFAPSGVTLRAEVASVAEIGAREQPRDRDTALLDADRAGDALLVRSWRAGDRMRPAGVGGSQKLQDLFVNRKVPRARRAGVPVVTTREGRVVWVAGLAVDEAFTVGPTTSRVVILRATHPGGKA